MKKRMLSALLAVCMMLTMVPVAFATDGLESLGWIDADDVEEGYLATVNPWSINQSGMLEITGEGQNNGSLAGYLYGGLWSLEMYLDSGESIPSNTSRVGEFGIGESFSTDNQAFPFLRYVFTEDNVVQDTEPRGGTYRFLLCRYTSLAVAEYLALPHELHVDLEDNAFQKVRTQVREETFDPQTGADPYPGTEIQYLDQFEDGAWYMVRDIFSYSGNNRHLSLVQAEDGKLPTTIEPNDYSAYEYSEVCKITDVAVDSTGYKASVSIEAPGISSSPDQPSISNPNITVAQEELTTVYVTTVPDGPVKEALQNAKIVGTKNALDENAIEQIIRDAGINPDSESEITVRINVGLSIMDIGDSSDNGYIVLAASPYAEITVDDGTPKSVDIPNSYLNGDDITVQLPIPSGFNLREILHISAGYPIEQYLQGQGFTIENGVAKLNITHFSELRMNETETVAAKIRGSETGYFSLQAAVDAASTSGDTIDLYKNCDDTVIQIASKSLTIDCNTYTINNDVDWQLTGCAKTESMDDESHRIITITRTSGSSSSSSGGGSSSSGNLVSVSQNNHGTISVSPNRAQTGDTVTVTIDPDEGYVLDELIVTDRNGNRVEVERISDNEYTFTKPSGLVKVEATFTEDEQPDASRIPFTDVATTAWYYDAVRYMYEGGMMNGTSANTFSPNETTTRAMIVTMLHRLEGEPNASGGSFTDVASSMYYADAIAWAQANGVVNGTSATTFSPDQAITREQMAAILYRYAQFKGYDVTAGNSLNAYTDASQISPYAATAMQWANAEGLITGNTATTINPAGNATRAEVATILMRFAENIA